MRNYFEFCDPTKINCGKNALQTIGAELGYFGSKKPLILASTNATRVGVTEKVLAALKGSKVKCSAVCDSVTDEVDLALLREMKKKFATAKCDGIVAVGGAGAIDSAKILKMFISENCEDFLPLAGVSKRNDHTIPLITVSTECGSGSEASGFVEVGDVFISTPTIIPDVVIVDGETAAVAPARSTAAGGIYALANAIEAFLGAESIAPIEAISQKAVKLVFAHLEKVAGGEEVEEDCLGIALASVLGGMAYGNAPYGAAHALAEALADVSKEPIEEMIGAALVAVLKKLSEEKKGRLVELLPYTCSLDVSAEIPKSEWAARTVENVESLILRLHESAGMPARLSDAKIQRELFGAIADAAQNKRSALCELRPIGQEEFIELLNAAY